MIPAYFQPVFLVIALLLLFFAGRLATNEFFYFFRLFFKNDKIIFLIISLLYLPGTIIHEMSHFFCAIALMLRVRSISIFPSFDKNYIKLGSVLYEKKDVLRSILVGVAPIFGGFLFFLFVSVFKLFPNSNLGINIILFYLIFAVSSTMFSSAKDLADLVFIIPILIVLSGIIYIFNIRLDFLFQNPYILKNFQEFASRVNSYLLFSVVINAVLIIFLKSFRLILQK